MQTEQEEFSPPEGQAGNTLTLKMKVEFSANYISHADLNQLVASTLNASVPQGFSPLGELTFNPLAEPVTDSAGVTHFELQAEQVTLRDINQMKIFSAIRGRDPAQAANDLTLCGVFACAHFGFHHVCHFNWQGDAHLLCGSHGGFQCLNLSMTRKYRKKKMVSDMTIWCKN